MFAWRNYLEVHPAADDYPLLKDSDPAAFRELVEDIRKHGLRANIVLWEDNDGKRLLDGRNRLDALAELGVLYDDIDAQLGLKSWTGTKWAQLSGNKIQFQHLAGGDPYALAASLNVHRRHLTAELKRDLIAKLLKARPDASSNSIAKQVKADDKTVAAVRREMEGRSEIPNVETRKDTKGRKQPAKKAKAITKPAPEQNEPKTSAERMKQAHGAAASERELAEASGDELSPEEQLEHYRDTLVIQAEQAADLAERFAASLKKCPTALTSEAIRGVYRAVDRWSALLKATAAAARP
jgi:hypothetical protein